MTEKLENKIIELIDDYLKKGLRVGLESYDDLIITLRNPEVHKKIKNRGGQTLTEGLFPEPFVISNDVPEPGDIATDGLLEVSRSIDRLAESISGENSDFDMAGAIESIAESLEKIERRRSK